MKLDLGETDIDVLMTALTEYLFSGEEWGYSERAAAHDLLERLSDAREGIEDGSGGIAQGERCAC